MKIYKVIYMNDQREKVLSGAVRADDGERWESLVQALNNLGSIGFEVETPIYGSVIKAAGVGQIIEAFLLVNRSATAASDLERRIKRTKALVVDAEKYLTWLSSDLGLASNDNMEKRTFQEQLLRKLRGDHQELEELLQNLMACVEPGKT